MIRLIVKRSVGDHLNFNKNNIHNNFRKMSQATKLTSTVKGALIDLSGTLHVEDEAIGNAAVALTRLFSKIYFFFSICTY